MKVHIFVTAVFFIFCSLQLSFAQVSHEGLAMKIVQVRKENAALLRQYTWNSRTELLDQGVLKDTR